MMGDEQGQIQEGPGQRMDMERRRNYLSVRQWQEKYQAGAFNAADRYTQCKSGWYDWSCQDHALVERMKKISKVVMGITDPFILDNYYVWFKNNRSLDGPLYDDVRFEPLSGERDGKYFVVTLDNPRERFKWSLITERYGFETPEFECGDIREMVGYINRIGSELQQGIKPPFIAEKNAVAAYAIRQGEPEGVPIHREGNHCYSYISHRDKSNRTVMAVFSLEDAPSGFAVEQAEDINGLHVYCPEDAGKDLPAPKQAQKKSHKRKEPER